MPLRFLQRIFSLRRSWIGIDWGADSGPRLAWLRRGFGPPRVKTLLLRDADRSLRARLREGSRCAAALPLAETLAIALQPPPLPPAKRKRVLPGLLDLKLPFPLEQCAFAFAASQDATLGFAARQDDVRKTIETLRAQGLDPEALTPLGWVLWRQALREVPASLPSGARVIALAQRESLTLVTGTGETFGTAVSLPAGDLAGVRRVLQMGFGRMPETLLCLCAGEDAGMLEDALPRALSPANVSARCLIDPGFFMARALAWEFGARSPGRIQLRQPPCEHPRSALAGLRALRTAALAGWIGGALLMGTSVILRVRIRERETAHASLLTERLNAVAGYPVATRGDRAVLEATEALEDRLDPVLERQAQPKVSTVLALVLRLAGLHGIRISHLEVTARGITLSGRAPSPEDVALFKRDLALEGQGVQAEVDPRATPEGETLFLMSPGGAR